MTHENMRLMLKVLRLVREMPRGKGWVGQSEIVAWSGVSRSTVYRYLPKMFELKLIEVREMPRGKKFAFEYRISPDGLEWLESLKQF
jgi:DNA-binding IclR family transcriptional regulator